jgi:hypothetical protein
LVAKIQKSLRLKNKQLNVFNTRHNYQFPGGIRLIKKSLKSRTSNQLNRYNGYSNGKLLLLKMVPWVVGKAGATQFLTIYRKNGSAKLKKCQE